MNASVLSFIFQQYFDMGMKKTAVKKGEKEKPSHGIYGTSIFSYIQLMFRRGHGKLQILFSQQKSQNQTQRTIFHQRIHVPNLEVLYLIRLSLRGGDSVNSLTLGRIHTAYIFFCTSIYRYLDMLVNMFDAWNCTLINHYIYIYIHHQISFFKWPQDSWTGFQTTKGLYPWALNRPTTPMPP